MESSIDLSRLKECLLKDVQSTRHISLQWRHTSLWNQRQHRLLNSLFRQQSKFSNSALLTLLGNPPVMRGIHWSPLESEMQRMFSWNKVPSPGPPSFIYFSLAWYSYSCQWDDCISVFGGPRILTVCVIWKRLNNSLCLSSTSLLFGTERTLWCNVYSSSQDGQTRWSHLIEAETKWQLFSRRHFNCISLNQNMWITIKTSLRFVQRLTILS